MRSSPRLTIDARFRAKPRTVRELAPVTTIAASKWDRLNNSLAFKFYVAQASAGAAAGFVLPIILYFHG